MTDPNASLRQLAPGPSPTSPTSKPKSSVKGKDRQRSPTHSQPWKKRVSTACLACKKSKRKCSGTAPCDNCRAFNRACIFDESLDQRRRVAQKRTADELNYHRDMLNDLFHLVRAADEPHALRLLEIIRKNATAEEIRAYIDETLARLDTSGGGGGGTGAGAEAGAEAEAGRGAGADDEAAHRLEDIKRMIGVEGAGPTFRRKVMDIHYLCDEAPCAVPAQPWTGVTEDAALVSHLVSLYFTWDYPFHAFLDRDVFLRAMGSGELASEFCSPFLVNALLANACHFSDFSEAYVVPGDLVTKGADFLSEAERLREQDPRKLSLAYLQGTLLLYERYSISGDDDLGYLMLHQAIRAGESLGLFGPGSVKLEDCSTDMDVSIKRTAWGLFHVDTVVHTGFLRPSLIDKINVDRVGKADDSDSTALWIPYPSHRAARPAYLHQYFEESCNLCEIARDISRALFADDLSNASAAYRRQIKEDLYERLRRWHNALPDVFDPGRRPPPHIILLRMRYFTLVINLFSSSPDDDVSSVASDAPQTPESPPRHSPIRRYHAWEITQSAARGIASLTRLHRREHGMRRAHHFALYAINLALFTMLEQDAFDVLDPDFLSLVSSFSILASRSHLGRSLFHIFRQSVRAKAQGSRIRASSAVSDELKDLFDEAAPLKDLTRWDEYAEGLHKLNEDERYHGIGEGEHGLQDYPGLGLFDMLDRYESLSLGKDEIVPERCRPE
ncbi:Zn(II)2Cys6 transcription factor [Aspergillus clavatus NRRL 1]|uniref:C6 transcription factor, putative n=1 Tax=Aspergillus clavatus (strain ATCC 1007 / CBS 513.65 / DSM 816 / NCTC 3887 / NRRL 1 / QM 1276 / 107) TaxID=344612 RepID=A1CG59_ASPCL|nr:C6 transcription factor, putative [Aspergillus clavatus NRRL 1]EAW10939.1 C6 transcription factor, putative [Aspergillus clavatus NRRL 1]